MGRIINKQRIKILLSLIVALGLSYGLSATVFVPNLPLVNTSFVTSLPQKTSRLFSEITTKFTFLSVKTVPTPSVMPGSWIVPQIDTTQHPALIPTTVHNDGSVAPVVPTSIQQPTQQPTLPVYPTQTPQFPTSPPSPTTAPITAVVSRSKMSIFILSSLTSGARSITQSGPRILKFMDPSQEQRELMRSYKQQFPGGIVMLRFFHTQGSMQFHPTDNPESSAERYFREIDGARLGALGEYKQYVDYITGPNEFEDLPYPWKMPNESSDDPARMRSEWNGRFWLKLSQLGAAAGVKTCILSIPPGNLGEMEIGAMIPYLKQMNNLRAAICYHDYAPSSIGSHYYRNYYSIFSRLAPELSNMPIIIDEAGFAATSHCGYQCSGGVEAFKSAIATYDNEIIGDSRVLGVTLFQIGDSGTWNSFNVEPIAGWMADYLRSK